MKKITTILIISAFIFIATPVFSAEDYNIPKLNTSTANDILTAPYTTVIEPKPISPTTISPILTPTINPPSTQLLPTTQTNTTAQSPTVSGLAPSTISSTAVKKCGVNTFSVSNECGVSAFKSIYFQCYDGYEEKQGGENSCKSSGVWHDYAQSVCVNRCGAAPTSALASPSQDESQDRQVPTTVPTAFMPMPTVMSQNVKSITVCYIPDKLAKDYNRLLIDLQKAELVDDKETAELIIKKIIVLKLEIEKARKECMSSSFQPRQMQLSTEVSPPTPIEINRCHEVTQWENKITYYKKLSVLSEADLKEQTGFSKEEIEKILSNLPNGLEKVRAQCEDQRNIVGERSSGTFSTEILSMDLTSITEPTKPVVVESGREIDDYYKARIEKITATEDIEEQIQNLKSLKEEVDELIAKLIKGRKEIEASELSNAVTEIKVSRGEIKADDVVIKTTDKKILFTISDKPVSIEPTVEGVIVRGWNPDGKEAIEVKAEEISIKDNILRVGNSEVKFAVSDVIENISKRPGRIKYANITLEKGIVLVEENGQAVYKIKEIEPRKLFGFIPIQITKTLTASAETRDLLDEKFPWYTFLTTR